MINIDESILINKRCENVFDFAGDYRNDTKWRTNVKELQLLSAGQMKSGVKTRELLQFMGKSYLTVAKITEFKHCRKISFTGENNSSYVQGSREFKPDGEGTLFRYSLEVRPKGFMKLLSPLLGRAFNTQIRKDLNNLKRILEN